MVGYTLFRLSHFLSSLGLLQKNSKILILNQEGDWWRGECDGQVGAAKKPFSWLLTESRFGWQGRMDPLKVDS